MIQKQTSWYDNDQLFYYSSFAISQMYFLWGERFYSAKKNNHRQWLPLELFRRILSKQWSKIEMIFNYFQDWGKIFPLSPSVSVFILFVANLSVFIDSGSNKNNFDCPNFFVSPILKNRLENWKKEKWNEYLYSK